MCIRMQGILIIKIKNEKNTFKLQLHENLNLFSLELVLRTPIAMVVTFRHEIL